MTKNTCGCIACAHDRLRDEAKEKDIKILDLRIRVTENLTRAEQAEVVLNRKRDQCDKLTRICGILFKDVTYLLRAAHSSEEAIRGLLAESTADGRTQDQAGLALKLLRESIEGAATLDEETPSRAVMELLAPIETDSEGRAKIAEPKCECSICVSQ